MASKEEIRFKVLQYAINNYQRNRVVSLVKALEESGLEEYIDDKQDIIEDLEYQGYAKVIRLSANRVGITRVTIDGKQYVESHKNTFSEMTNEQNTTEDKKEVFVTYSWDSEEHKTKVLSFTNFLRDNGFHADIDRKKSQESTSTDFTKMMHQGITDYNKVIIILTEGYKKKANAFERGVGKEYQMIIKDIEENPNKYVLVCFGNIHDNMFPTALKDREVINVDQPKNHKVLFAKMQDKEIIKFSEVAKNKPQIEVEEIPKFGTLIEDRKESVEITELTTKPEAGSFMRGGLYFKTKHLISFSFENIGQSIIENCLIQISIPENLTPYDSRVPIKSGYKIYKKKIDDKIYPSESEFIEMGNIEITNKTAEEAFQEKIKVSINDGVSKFVKEYDISEIVYVTNPFRGYRKEELSQDSYHDKFARE